MFRQWHKYYWWLLAKYIVRIGSKEEEDRKIWKTCSLPRKKFLPRQVARKITTNKSQELYIRTIGKVPRENLRKL
jgi:hypothetical protein